MDRRELQVRGFVVPALAQQRVLPSATANPPPTTRAPAPPVSSTPSQATDTPPRMYIELGNRGNFDLPKSVLPSPAYMNSHGHRVVMDQVMLKSVITAWRNSMPDLNLKIEDTIALGDKIAIRLTLTGSYRAILLPTPLPRIGCPCGKHPGDGNADVPGEGWRDKGTGRNMTKSPCGLRWGGVRRIVRERPHSAPDTKSTPFPSMEAKSPCR